MVGKVPHLTQGGTFHAELCPPTAPQDARWNPPGDASSLISRHEPSPPFLDPILIPSSPPSSLQPLPPRGSAAVLYFLPISPLHRAPCAKTRTRPAPISLPRFASSSRLILYA